MRDVDQAGGAGTSPHALENRHQVLQVSNSTLPKWRAKAEIAWLSVAYLIGPAGSPG